MATALTKEKNDEREEAIKCNEHASFCWHSVPVSKVNLNPGCT